MARIETDLQDGRTVTVTRAGATKRTHHSHGGVLTVRNDEARDVLRRLGAMGVKATLVSGSLDDDDSDVLDGPPVLPPPPPLTD